MALGATGALALGVAACGEDDFENDPRPASPVDLTAKVTRAEVVVSPGEVGGGLATFTISNQSEDPVSLTLSGPMDIASTEIPPAGVGNLQADLEEGTYEVSGGERSDARPDTLTVGPERASSQNKLLLP